MGAQEAVQQQITAQFLRLRAAKDQAASQAEAGRRRRRLPTVVALRRAGCNQVIAFLRQGVGNQELQLARLVPARCQSRLVIALDIDGGPAQMLPKPLQFLNWSRQMGDLDTFRIVWVHGWCRYFGQVMIVRPEWENPK